jgi:hypothetical protein
MRPIRHLHHGAIAIVFATALIAFAQDHPPIDDIPGPMSSFSRMIGGEWRMTAASGTSMCDTWNWGPGHYSMRVMTEGEAADGSPWYALEVVYWHPGREQVCRLSMHPFIAGIGRGVGEGTIRFEGDTADAVVDLYQGGNPRRLRLYSVFEGPDKFHATLSEATGRDQFTHMVEWDYFRVASSSTKRPPIPDKARNLPEQLRAFQPLVGRTWETRAKVGGHDAPLVRSAFEFVPIAEYIYVRTLTLSDSGEATHVLDSYFYHHVGTNRLRCLALSHTGTVYEGDVVVLEGGSFQIELQGYERRKTTTQLVRFDFESDGSVRNRVWTIEGSDRILVMEDIYKMLDPVQN